ncbi:MAG: SpoIID/LytB domain-containing protein [Eubacteriales bacterium]|nr:SpoIID/LytB domain-containing protein [Eubacteriales bacterium]
MKGFFWTWLWAVPVLLLFSYVTTAVVNGGERALELRGLDGEMCLPAILFLEIGPDYEPEAVKAQAVIARSNFYRRLQEGETLGNILRETGEKIRGKTIFSVLKSLEKREGLYEEAVGETAGWVLAYEGKLRLVPYHEISGGRTRNGEEVFRSQEYAYLTSVESLEDKRAGDLLSSRYKPAEQLPKQLKIREKDSSGYVTVLEANGYLLEGETFAQGMGLASSNFTIQRLEDKVRFLCRGRGHGLGFSQHGGNEMAKAGKTWKEILTAYFPKMELVGLEQIERRAG